MISDNKLIYNMENVRRGLPITADIFLTNYCNNRCGYCAYGRWKELQTEPRYMRAADFEKYMYRLLDLGVKGMILTGGGEPTVNPDFTQIVKTLESNGVNYGINTNFNRYCYMEPVFAKISVDAWDRASYKAIRGVDNFEAVVENVRRYRRELKQAGARTQLVVQCVGKSWMESAEFRTYWKSEDVDKIDIRPVESTPGEYYNQPDNEKERQLIMSYLANIKDERLVLNYKFGAVRRRFPSCVANSTQIAINERGEVMYCCHKPYEIVGHVMDEDILEKKQEYFTNIAKCDVPCRLTAPNEMMLKMADVPNDWMFI